MRTGMPEADLSAHYTPDDLLRLSDSVGYELVKGRLLPRHSGMLASQVAANVATELGRHLDTTKAGHVLGPDAGYHCFPDQPDTVRKPDVSVVLRGRFPGQVIPKGHSPVPPDLAVEVTSPGDLVQVLEEKITDYLRAGVRLAWVVSPRTRTVTVYRPRGPDDRVSLYTEAETITGESVLPGFACQVTTFFD